MYVGASLHITGRDFELMPSTMNGGAREGCRLRDGEASLLRGRYPEESILSLADGVLGS